MYYVGCAARVAAFAHTRCAPVKEVLRMSSIEIRSFRRSDREQLTYLVNIHAAAVIRVRQCQSTR